MMMPAPQNRQLPGPPTHAAPVSFQRRAMACDWELFIWGQAAPYARQAADAAWAELERLEGELSRFRVTSDIARLNRLRPGERLRIGADGLACLTLARRMFDATAGAFDVTIGALLNRDGAVGRKPFGLHNLVIDPASRSVAVLVEGLVVDLGGIGKGYALDQLGVLLQDWGVESALLHSGQSTVLAIGRPPDGPAFRVGVRDPADPGRVLGTIDLCGAALSGSGAAIHGAHIIDPRRGDAASACVAAWALAPTAAEADALSTACMALSPDEAQALCARRPDVSVLQALAEGAGARMAHGGQAFASLSDREV